MNLAQFANRMKQLASNVITNQSTRTKESAMAVVKELVIETPVDVGTAKSNWVVSVGSKWGGRVDAHVPGRRGSTSGSNAAITLAKAQLALKNYKSSQYIYISNNSPYIGLLNAGSSTQSPGKFIETAMAKAKGPMAIIAKRGVLHD